MRRPILALLLAALLAALPAAAPAQNEPPNAEEFREIGRRVLEGDAVEEEAMAFLRRGFGRFLLQPPMHVGLAARYEIAELFLARGDIRNALLRLQEVAASIPKEDEVLWVTRFNMAELYYLGMNDTDRAVAEFAQVKGNLEAVAQREMFTLLENDPNRQAQVVALFEKRATETKDPGERFALLMRLGRYYKRQKQPDKAVEVFERVAREATPEVIEGLRRRIQEDVRAAGRRMRALREQDRHDEAHAMMTTLHRRANQLRILDRHDEAAALQRALERLEMEGEGVEPARPPGIPGEPLPPREGELRPPEAGDPRPLPAPVQRP